jgi:hypothetical protein
MSPPLILKRASASRPSGEWNEDDFDVLADGAVVGRIFKANASPVGASWMWTLAFGHHQDRTPDARLCRDTRRRDGRIRKELAASLTGPRDASCIAVITTQQFFALRD